MREDEQLKDDSLKIRIPSSLKVKLKESYMKFGFKSMTSYISNLIVKDLKRKKLWLS